MENKTKTFIRICKYFPSGKYQAIVCEEKKVSRVAKEINGLSPWYPIGNASNWFPIRKYLQTTYNAVIPPLNSLKWDKTRGHDSYAEFYLDGSLR